MTNLRKLKVTFLIFTIFLASEAFAADRILPVSKPTPDQETKIKTAEKKYIYPEKKPTLKKEKVEVAESKEIDGKAEEEVFIYPKKKPLIVAKKIDKTVVKSSVVSKRDFKLAKTIFSNIEKRKWKILHFKLPVLVKSYNLIIAGFLVSSFVTPSRGFCVVKTITFIAPRTILLKVQLRRMSGSRFLQYPRKTFSFAHVNTCVQPKTYIFYYSILFHCLIIFFPMVMQK